MFDLFSFSSSSCNRHPWTFHIIYIFFPYFLSRFLYYFFFRFPPLRQNGYDDNNFVKIALNDVMIKMNEGKNATDTQLEEIIVKKIIFTVLHNPFLFWKINTSVWTTHPLCVEVLSVLNGDKLVSKGAIDKGFVLVIIFERLISELLHFIF